MIILKGAEFTQTDFNSVSLPKQILYVRLYKPPLVYFLPHFFTAVFMLERLVLKTIFVLKKGKEKEISRMGYNGACSV